MTVVPQTPKPGRQGHRTLCQPRRSRRVVVGEPQLESAVRRRADGVVRGQPASKPTSVGGAGRPGRAPPEQAEGPMRPLPASPGGPVRAWPMRPLPASPGGPVRAWPIGYVIHVPFSPAPGPIGRGPNYHYGGSLRGPPWPVRLPGKAAGPRVVEGSLCWPGARPPQASRRLRGSRARPAKTPGRRICRRQPRTVPHLKFEVPAFPGPGRPAAVGP